MNKAEILWREKSDKSEIEGSIREGGSEEEKETYFEKQVVVESSSMEEVQQKASD